MKRTIFAVVAIAIAMVMAAPAMAVDLGFKGEYRVRAFSDAVPSLDTLQKVSDSWMEHRFRLQTTFTVTDNLSITTRFDAMDEETWGRADVTAPARLTFDRVYMTIKTDYGMFDIGRQQGGVWGTSFADSEWDADRIKFTTKIDNFIIIGIYEKQDEVDAFINASDTDRETYWLAGVYRGETFTAGLLTGYTQDKRASENVNSFQGKFWRMFPYFKASWEDFTLQGEAVFAFGKAAEWDQGQYQAANTYPGTVAAPFVFGGVTYTGGPFKDIDFDAWMWNLEAGYGMGPLAFEMGYAWAQGQGTDGPFDANGLPSQTNSKVKTLGTLGVDWDKLYILTSTENALLTGGLGGSGNLNAGGTASQAGAKIFYLGATFKPMENLSLGVMYGNAKAESVTKAGQSDNYGNEYDFKLVWDIMDNLQYTFIAAYLDAGDFWQREVYDANYIGAPAPLPQNVHQVKLENTYSLFHELSIAF
ncbi:MAG: hypothetical protein QMD09_03980 [Desulfatibacillaceae bacterium]|nr:hypothetical protein [Desulfatibacillaceae bacterium]